jgi:hypothetical protein
MFGEAGGPGPRRSSNAVTVRGQASKSASTPLAMLGYACAWLRAAGRLPNGEGLTRPSLPAGAST